MIGVVDSGSTKAHWVFLEKGQQVAEFFTIGLNPNSTSTDVMLHEIRTIKANMPVEYDLNSLYFYGSGCLGSHGAGIVNGALNLYFPKVDITVESDLVAAGIALYGMGEGIASILGTGASCCYFCKGKVVAVAPSLGYILGDEGSGSFLGKRLLKAYFYNHMPADLVDDFKETCDNKQLLFDLYHSSSPAGYLASFVPFLIKHRGHSFVDDLVFKAFDQFFLFVVNPLCATYKRKNIGVVGSIGFEFQDVIQRAVETHGVVLEQTIQYPMEKLLAFHRG
ncbi:hypothetical protein [Williamwhitmania taraxaci]|uniref:BadF-type ATPase n=1 Tax=Williamwhitmania taraxaci TaxID=1640674 RepID=A0A1G6GQM7_9BACT|nr:hypothetical protein [Williamwhitmania taraxaci]SDB84209.1 hypothetical protein SAMN05216323_100324 [Williamwhitmania taraxaci]